MTHVRDLWMVPGPNGRKVRGPRYGKGKRWQARWTEAGRDKSKLFPSRDAAQAHLDLVAVHGPFKPRPRTTVAEYAATWRNSQRQLRDSTKTNVEQILRLMVQPELGRLPLADVTRQDIENAVQQWETHYTAARVQLGYTYTKRIFADAVLNGVIDSTPCVNISMPAKPHKRVKPLTVEQVQHIADHVMPHWRTAILVGAATGLRIGELGGLTYDRVTDGTVTVDRQLVDVRDGRPVFGPPKSKAGYRDVPMGTAAWTELQAHLEQHPRNPHGLIWVSQRGGPLTGQLASEVWERGAKGLDLPDRHGWHQLRHFHASALIAAGLSPRAVADRLGQADVSTLLRVYSHLWPNDQERSVQAMDAILRPLATTAHPSAT